MKKIGFLLILAMFFAFSAHAQKGKKQFNIGLGFDNSTIPIYLGLDFWVHQDISIGGSVGWRRHKFDYLNDKYYTTLINFSLPVNYHFSRILGVPNKWDIYAGLSIGFFHWSNNVDDDNWKDDNTSGLGLGGQLGVRYFFNSKIGINLEFAGGNHVSDGKIGLSILF